MGALAQAAKLALTHPQAAAKQFVVVMSDDIADWLERLLTAPDGLLWLPEEHIQSFDAVGTAYRVDGEWGSFWLVPSWMKDSYRLDTNDPRVSPRALKALAQALLGYFKT